MPVEVPDVGAVEDLVEAVGRLLDRAAPWLTTGGTTSRPSSVKTSDHADEHHGHRPGAAETPRRVSSSTSGLRASVRNIETTMSVRTVVSRPMVSQSSSAVRTPSAPTNPSRTGTGG